MKIGLLTGGGDCPGLNAVIRAIGKKGIVHYGDEFIGLINGWAGLMSLDYVVLERKNFSGILHLGGTILGSSRTNPEKEEGGYEQVIRNFKELGLDALIVIGGNDTLGVAVKLHKLGIPIVGVPKTIDNDISATDMTFGFDTAVSVATEAIDRLHTTAESHHRCIVVEVMGRHAGWIATYAGIAGGADYVLIPEQPFEIQDVIDKIQQRMNRGKFFSIIVVAEGVELKEEGWDIQIRETDDFGNVRLGGIGALLAREIEKRIGIESRAVVLGHVQRGGTPTAYDRVLGSKYGITAIDMVHNGHFGMMTSLQGTKVRPVPIEEGVKESKVVDKETYEIAQAFFG
ncbi:MAG: 6-phosphofructokinase [Candidatus Heimdallarchaeota archaeon]|nr:6-phosphofructokinase [Candidatus Heimdallarchaeota archaeon]MCK4878211.1 6-phosphofructokinase [Candidatus Heimdallarchaeota archaeon]